MKATNVTDPCDHIKQRPEHEVLLDEPLYVLSDASVDIDGSMPWHSAVEAAFLANDDAELGRQLRKGLEFHARQMARLEG